MKLQLRASVVLMQNDDLCLLGDSNLNSFEKLRLLSPKEFNILLSIKDKKNIENNKDSNDIIRKWINEGVIVEINEKYHQRKKMEKIKSEMMAFKKVKLDSEVINYHQNIISNASTQFDFNETTLSHVYRDKNPILNNLSYGEALVEKLLEFKPETENLSILEIGCGTGLLAKNILNQLKEAQPNIYKNVKYSMYDLSPALRVSQEESTKDHLEKVNFITGNIEEENFNEKYDLIICNEVIADLNVCVCDKDVNLCEEKIQKLITKYNLSFEDFPSKFILNYQAIRFIEKIPKWLSSSGVAFISEYGSWNEVPKVVTLPGHNEYSINFSHLSNVATGCGLKSTFVSMDKFLDFDSDVMLLDDKVRETFSDYILPFLGYSRLERVPSDIDSIRELLGDKAKNFKRLPFSPLAAERSTLNPISFKALVLKK